MLGRLPPLNALKAFEAAARHETFTRAAEELCVTRGAVSHQVKALEAELGIKPCLLPAAIGSSTSYSIKVSPVRRPLQSRPRGTPP